MQRDATRRRGCRAAVIVLRLRRQPPRGADAEARRWALGLIAFALGWIALGLGGAGAALFMAYLAIAN